MRSGSETIHASAVVVGERAVIVRGPSGSGKSRLVAALLDAAKTGLLPYARLVADDRIRILAAGGRLVVSAPETIRGMMEVAGLGIRSAESEAIAVAGLVVDLAAPDAARMPKTEETQLLGVPVPRLPVSAGEDPFPIVLAALTTKATG